MRKLILFIFLTGSVAIAAAISSSGPVENREYDSMGVEKIHVENTSGKITVTPSDRNKVLLTLNKIKFPEKCNLSVDRANHNQITVKVEKPIGVECEVDIDIKAPKQVNLNLWSGSGAMSISGIEGELLFNVGSGEVNADGKFKNVEGKSGSGDINIKGVAGGGSVNVGSGSVHMRFNESLTGQMDIKAGSGDAVLAFPKGSKISADLKTGSGDLTNDLGSSESADYGVSAKTGSGDVKVTIY